MQKLVFWLLLPLVASAGGKMTMSVRELNRWTVVDSGRSGYGSLAPELNQRGPGGVCLFGRLDTVGGTTYDWQTNGPAAKMTAYSPIFGTHVTWMCGASGSPWDDRNMRYNFHDQVSWQFNAGPEFLQWGVNVFTLRCGYGFLDVGPVSGCAYVSSHMGYSDHNYIGIARDSGPGWGRFEIDTSTSGGVASFLWPAMSVSDRERVHIGMVDYPARTALYYTNVDWPDWLTPVTGDFEPLPGFPTHSIDASHLSRVCMTWQYDNSGSGGNLPYPAYYRLSWDDGNTWDNPVQLPFPPAFYPVPGETLGASFHISSVTPFFDWHDNLHIVASVFCAENESMLYYVPVEIWHWSETDGWNRVVRAMEDSLPRDGSAYGYNAIYATRPTLAGDDAGRLVCVWEQFDCWNIEPQTLRWRAEIWGAGSSDNGRTWNPPVRLTDPDETSKRFPSVAEEFKADSVVIGYEVDLCAGFIVQVEGDCTDNPWVVQTVPLDAFGLGVAVAEGGTKPYQPALDVTPNPARGALRVAYDLADAGRADLSVADCCGRRVRTLATGRRDSGRYEAAWDGTDDVGRRLAAGVYFVLLQTGKEERRCRVVFVGH